MSSIVERATDPVEPKRSADVSETVECATKKGTKRKNNLPEPLTRGPPFKSDNAGGPRKRAAEERAVSGSKEAKLANNEELVAKIDALVKAVDTTPDPILKYPDTSSRGEFSRISKMTIVDDEEWVFNYDRGFDSTKLSIDTVKEICQRVLTERDLIECEDVWFKTTIKTTSDDKYKVSAKVFDVGSKYGIHIINGKITDGFTAADDDAYERICEQGVVNQNKRKTYWFRVNKSGLLNKYKNDDNFWFYNETFKGYTGQNIVVFDNFLSFLDNFYPKKMISKVSPKITFLQNR